MSEEHNQTHLSIVTNRHVRQSVDRHDLLLLWRTSVDHDHRYDRQSIYRHNQLLSWRNPVDRIDRYQQTLSTVSLSPKSTLALKNSRRSCRSFSIDTIDSQLINPINSCSEETLSMISILINRHDRQSVDRHSQLLLSGTPGDRMDRYQSTRLTVSWSTLSTVSLKNTRRSHWSWSIDTIESQLIDKSTFALKNPRRLYRSLSTDTMDSQVIDTIISNHHISYRSLSIDTIDSQLIDTVYCCFQEHSSIV